MLLVVLLLVTDAFAGNSLVGSSFIHFDASLGVSWIVGTEASDHMSSQLRLFNTRRTLQRPILIRLLDGTTKTVTVVGNITIHSEIVLKDVLYVKDFKYICCL